MPLEYSYKVELQRLKTQISALEKDIFLNPENERAKKLLADKQQEVEWFQKKIDAGEDPGVRIL